MEPLEKSKHRKGRKGRWIFLCVLAVLVAGVAAIGFWQKNNLEAVAQFTQYTQEELEEQLEMNDKHVQEILEEALNAAQQVERSVDDEGETQQSPETTTDPEKDPGSTENIPVTEKDPTEKPAAVEKPSAPAVSPPTKVEQKPDTPAVTPAPAPENPPVVDSGPTYEDQLKVIVDKVYALRSEYLQALDDLQAEAVADYKAIPTEKRGAKELTGFVSKYISRGTALERECDGKMDALIKELRALLKKYGQDMELIDAVKYTYAQEKSLKKAWYMSELERRGLI